MNEKNSYAAQTAIRASAAVMRAATKLDEFSETPGDVDHVLQLHISLLDGVIAGADRLLPYILEHNGEGGDDQSWRDDPATDKQKKLMDKHGIDWKDGITKGEASDLLDKKFNKAR